MKINVLKQIVNFEYNITRRGKEKAMTDQEWYEYGQEHCGIKEGDIVRVLREAKSREMGWAADWYPTKSRWIGKSLKVLENEKAVGFRLDTKEINYYFPWFVLELVKKALAKPELPLKIMEAIEQDTPWDKSEEDGLKALSKAILEEVKNDARNE